MVTETNQANGNALEMGNANQDLPAGKPESINKRKIVLTAIVGCLVVGLIILCIVLLTGQTNNKAGTSLARTDRRHFPGVEFEQILDGSFSPNRFNGSFISDTEILYKTEENDVVVYDVVNKTTQVVISGDSPILESALSYRLSADRQFLLVAHTFQKLYRYSYIAHYDIFNLKTLTSFPLKWTDGSRLILLAEWAPTGNGIAFVLQNTNDIYYKPTAEAPGFRITNTGVPTVIYNGVPDWVNEEEVFSSNTALWFSKDNKKLAFASFNDTFTRVMSIPFYGLPGNLDFQYTRAVNIRYPKPGSPNPSVRLHIADLEEFARGNNKIVEALPPEDLRHREPILTAVTWADLNHLSAVWMNRVQNLGSITICRADQPDCKNILSLREPKGWIDLFVPPIFSADGSKMALILPQIQEGNGTEGEFRHVCFAEKGAGDEYIVRALTKGKNTVTEILHYNEVSKLIFYLATSEGHPEQLHLYQVSTESNNSNPRCITCASRNQLQDIPCLYNKAVFSGGNQSIYALSCLGPGVPEISINNLAHEKLLTWEDNMAVVARLAGHQLPIVERLSVPVPGGFNAQVVLYLPPDVDRSGDTKYPLLVNVYGGPDSYQSTEKFNVDWNTYLTVNKSIIYATIDGRGSGLKGNNMLFAIYKRLGTYEIQDQINVTRFLQNKFSYIDRYRTAIWGWSYGGYATGMALAQDGNNVFKCGISVAPVTDWAYYDTIYTERYMGLPRPEDNLIGYARAQLNDKVENLRSKQYFLIHGTLDDNVHYQQSMMLSRVLEQSDILFRQQSYPDEEHGLAGVRPHLYHTLEKFLDECFEIK